VRVHWTDVADRQLLAIFEHIAKDSPRYALRMIDRITARTKQIGSFPESGGVVREYASAEVREVIEYPYRVIYRIGTDQIDVIAVVHGARLLPTFDS
jgi:toxin ParE1/3/4